MADHCRVSYFSVDISDTAQTGYDSFGSIRVRGYNQATDERIGNAFPARHGTESIDHGPLHVFFSLYLQSHGYTAFEAGQLWAIGVLAEVVLFFVLPHFIRSIDLRLLLTLSLVFGSMRWVLIGIYPDWPWLLIGLQLLHAFTFGAIHSVSIEFIRRWFPGKLSGRGMALYSGFVFGLGGSLGATLSGITGKRLAVA